MSSSWGRVNSSRQIGNGVRIVNCESHGGILITEKAMQSQPFLNKLKDYPGLKEFISDRGGYEFEEDCDASIINLAFGKTLFQKVWSIPDEKIDEIWNSVNRSVIKWNPSVYTYLTGIGLSIFDSYKLLESHLVESGNDVFKFAGSLTPDIWDIEQGMRVASVYHSVNVQEQHYFLVSEEYYQERIYKYRHLPIDISGLTKIERPNRRAV